MNTYRKRLVVVVIVGIWMLTGCSKGDLGPKPSQSGSPKFTVSVQLRPVLSRNNVSPERAFCLVTTQAPDAPYPTNACTENNRVVFELGPAFVTEAGIVGAEAVSLPGGKFGVLMRLNEAGRVAMSRITRKLQWMAPPRNEIAVLLGPSVRTTFVVQAQIQSGTVVVDGFSDMPAAEKVAAQLNAS